MFTSMKRFKARIYYKCLVLSVEEFVLELRRFFEGPRTLSKLVGEEVEVDVGDLSLYGVIEDVNGVWVKLRGKSSYKEEDYEYLVPVFNIRYVKRIKPVSQGTP
jgi:hypothetical protein